jgi:hypothetical protein
VSAERAGYEFNFASAGKIGKRRVDVWRESNHGGERLDLDGPFSLSLLSTNCISTDNELATIVSSDFCVASSDNP